MTKPSPDGQDLALGSYQPRVEARLAAWKRAEFARRLWSRDFTLWSPKPLPELSDRLGWLTLPETMLAQADALIAFANEVQAQGCRHVVLLGMGGSSLAPEVFQRTFGNAPGHPELVVLDSTHPAAVRAVEARVDLRQTLFLVSSKSGTTTETSSFFHYFWDRVTRVTNTPGQHFVAITDPATPLETLASQRGFRRVFPAPPDVGGRYSALSVFGLVPAALIGVNVRHLLERARAFAQSCSASVPEPSNPALALGAAMGELALAGRDKITFLSTPSLEAFPVWAEQLIAESTGKDGKGIVPVADEPPAAPESYGTDRVFVGLSLEGEAAGDLDSRLAALAARHPIIRIRLREKSDLGAEFFRWEVAVAVAGAILGIHPFDQPDVQLAKDLAKQAMAQPSAKPQELGRAPDTVSVNHRQELTRALRDLLDKARPGDYIALQAYLDPAPDITAALQTIRRHLRDGRKLPTTAGFGPRFLHSTGQLHKGGPNTGIFLQLLDEPAEDLPVPATTYTFGQLVRAQALGDFQALRQRGRRVLRIELGKDASAGLKQLAQALLG